MRLTALIHQFVVTALDQHELAADEDADEDADVLTFELNGIILAANTNFVLREDPAALDLARIVVRRRLGITTAARPPATGRDHPVTSRARRTPENIQRE